MSEKPQVSKHKLNLALDLRVVVGLLLVVIAVLLILWRPWSPATSDRTITVSGEATVSAEPDEYRFMPSYKFTGNQALEELTETSQTIVERLKQLGVAENQIKTNADNYQGLWLTEPDSSGNDQHLLNLEITITNQDLAQDIQDYLLTTKPTGSITPYLTFSDNKRRELESQARDQATVDARAKAEQSATNLGFKLGAVKEVNDGSGFGVMPYRGLELNAASPAASDSLTLNLQPGENDVHYSVTVVYYVR